MNNEKNENIGLMFSKKDIVRYISGPVSMYYLKPKEDSFRMIYEEYGYYLSLVLLFGDIHFSKENMCSDDTDKYYNIYDDNFISKFDTIADITPIDFFVETSPYENIKNPMIISPLKILKKEYKDCFDLKLRDTSKYELCPTKNIRWHYSDIRLYKNKIEGHIFSYFLYFRILYDNIKKGSIGINSYEFEQTQLDNDLHSFMPKPNNSNYILEKHLNLSTKGFVLELFNLFIEDPTNSDKMTILISNIINTVQINSLLYKQMNYSSPKHKLFWESIIKFSIYSDKIFLRDLEKLEIGEYKELLINIKNELIEGKYSIIIRPENNLKYTIILGILKDIFERFTAKLLDLYFLSRLFKNPEDNINSTLSICYFGNEHIKIIYEILKNIGYNTDFDKKLSKIDNKVNRCIAIDKLIDLENDVTTHSSLKSQESIKKYIEKLKLEREKRLIQPSCTQGMCSIMFRPKSIRKTRKSKTRKSIRKTRKSKTRKSIRKTRKSKTRKSIRKTRKS